MCEPMTMAAIMVAAEGVKQYGTREAAKTQFAANATQRERQNEEIRAASNAKAGERVKKLHAEQARLLVAAGEAGVGGNSFTAQLQDAAFQSDMDVAMIGKDAQFQDRASESRFLSANAQVDNPSLLQNVAGLAMAGVSGYAAGAQLEALKVAPTVP